MRYIIQTAAGILIGALLLIAGSAQALEGQFEAMGPIPQMHSQDVVVFEEFLNFSCPHCNAFRVAAKPLLAKYGTRVRRVYVPILFRGQPDHPVRLFIIAQAEGKEEEARNRLFDAVFRFNANIYNPEVVGYLARELQLNDAYRRHVNAAWVTEKVQLARARSLELQIRGTPTVVLAGTIKVIPRSGMQAFVGNLDRLITQLLKPRS